jgi:site-specific DNA-methyltransferase (cytosine-N4-specific)
MAPEQMSLFADREAEYQISDWDFRYADTQYLTHGLHPYPARMVPQIASKLMDLYLNGNENAIVADVFCGSGTVNVEASIKGFKSIGIDINPFAVLLAKTKVTNLNNFQGLTNMKERIEKDFAAYRTGYSNLVPEYRNIEHWFKKNVIVKLSYLKHIVQSRRNKDIKNILWITFANTLVKSSNVDWKSSRYIRILPKEKLRDRNPNVFGYFRNYLFDISNRVKHFSEKKKAEALIIRSDARRLPLVDNSVDIIITSPPYGEERNTIPYIRWSKLFLLWLGIADIEISSLEKQSLGGNSKNLTKKEDIPSNTFWLAVGDVPEGRLNEALPFMKDYVTTLSEMKRIVKPGARCCIVIGHRSISRHLIDMGKVTNELGEHVGLEPESIFQRTIPKKMIPWTGPTGETIFDESIVVLRKPK